MIQYVLRRVAHVIPLLILVSIISFFLIQLPPGDIAETFILERIQLGDYPDEQRFRKSASATCWTAPSTSST